jgi:hypothetical protein
MKNTATVKQIKAYYKFYKEKKRQIIKVRYTSLDTFQWTYTHIYIDTYTHKKQKTAAMEI